MSTELDLYKKMYLMRASEEAIIKYYPEDEMKTPMHMSMGEEAIVAGVCHALSDADYALGTYRSHALYLGKTGETRKFFAELYGRCTGTAKGKGGSMHLSSPEKGLLICSAIVGATISIANGVALACQMRGENRVTVVFFGDGATDSGTFWESINYAALEQLPILFVHEDNDLAVHARKTNRHGHSGIEAVLQNYNLEVLVENSNDPMNIFKKASTAVNIIKEERRPVFLSSKYYRYLEHVGINTDFHEDYRGNEASNWIDFDPVINQRKKIIDRDILGKKELKETEKIIVSSIEESILMAKNESFSKISELYTDIFA
jgi:TPP-dependent pyruvate/acetoin dehydrogenase alpha subunit